MRKTIAICCTAALLFACSDELEDFWDDGSAGRDEATASSGAASQSEDDSQDGLSAARSTQQVAAIQAAATTEQITCPSPPTEAFTYTPEYIEIDRLPFPTGDSLDFGDANLHAFDGDDAAMTNCVTPNGADPEDGSCDARLPVTSFTACTSPTQAEFCLCTGNAALDTPACIDLEYIDWNELLTDSLGNPDPTQLAVHRLCDAVKDDPSSFKNDSCVTDTKVLGKMDLTAGAVSNNTDYAYLSLKRYGNNGDAGYSWIFSKLEPLLVDSSDCAQGQQLQYTLTQGDVLIRGNFNPSAGADLVVRRATSHADGLTFIAANLVDPALQTPGLDPVWETVAGATNLPAVNTTPTALGVMEHFGGVDEAANRTDKNALSGIAGSYAVGSNIFAEAAVDLDAFTTGNGNLCDLSFWGTVATQSSSSPESDLKDLLGPRRFNFGSLSATASVSPSCDKAIDYQIDTLTAFGQEITDPESSSAVECDWTFTHAGTAAEKTVTDDCAGTLTLDPGDPAGNWIAEVQISVVTGLTCSIVEPAGSVDVYEPVVATADASPGCGLDFDYSGTATGGSPAATPTWTFTGPGTTTPTPTDPLSGSVAVDTAGSYTATLTVTDDRGDITCSDDDSDSVEVAEALQITPDLTQTCQLRFDYDVTITGGVSTPTISWAFSGPDPTPTPATSPTKSGSVDVDQAGSYTGTVTVSEVRGGKTCEVSASDATTVWDELSITSVNLTPTCDLQFGYAATYTGGSPAATTDWTFSGPGNVVPASTSNLSGDATVDAAGSYSGVFTITDDLGDIICTVDATPEPVDAYDPLDVTVTTTDRCDDSFDYASSYTGGSGAVTYAWTFGGAGTITPTTTTGDSGNAAVSPADTDYTASLTITDQRTDIECTDSDSDSAHPYSPITVSIAPDSESEVCPEPLASDPSFTDAVVYTATVTGGDGSYTYHWTGCTSSSNGSCTVNPADNNFCAATTVYVQVDDGSALCDPETSEEETYEKRTIISASNN